MDSYVKNCHLSVRPGDPTMFDQQRDGTVTARLDGYAVIPMEEFNRLQDSEPSEDDESS